MLFSSKQFHVLYFFDISIAFTTNPYLLVPLLCPKKSIKGKIVHTFFRIVVGGTNSRGVATLG